MRLSLILYILGFLCYLFHIVSLSLCILFYQEYEEWKTNFQGTLNWIIQIPHYYCKKQHKNIENSQIIEQNVVISHCDPLAVYCDLYFLCLPQQQSFFSSWTQYSAKFHKILNVTSGHLCRIVSLTGLKIVFSS